MPEINLVQFILIAMTFCMGGVILVGLVWVLNLYLERGRHITCRHCGGILVTEKSDTRGGVFVRCPKCGYTGESTSPPPPSEQGRQ